MNRAYSVLTVKSFDEEKRVIEGIATTPTPDRMGDVIVPEGMKFEIPLPLLWQHQSGKPIGHVTFAKVSKDGIAIRAQGAEPGITDWIDEAWALIKAKLVRGLSVGFRPLEDPVWDKALQGFRFLKTELMELSAVTIPANAEATILTVKSACSAPAGVSATRRVVSLRLDTPTQTIPGASGGDTNGRKMTIKEQITALENKRAALVARNGEIAKKAADESRSMDETEGQEFDDNQANVGACDKDLVRLRAHEKTLITNATRVTEENTSTEEKASNVRGGGVVLVKGADLPKGTALVRYAMCLAAAAFDKDKGGRPPIHFARMQKSWRDQTPQVEAILKAAVDTGDTTTSGWAAELADYTYMASEFIEFLRPQTIIGRIPNLRRVPFNIKLPLQDAGASVSWVGEGAVKPVTKLHFDTITLRFHKAAGIVVVTDELVKFSNPSIESLIRTDLSASMAQFLDVAFLDPSVTAVGDVSPASITNGAGNDSASGLTSDDLRNDFAAGVEQLSDANIGLDSLVLVMQPMQALRIGALLNTLGQPEFPTINAGGGTLFGYQVITSNSVPDGLIVLLKPSEILLADDGQVDVEASRQASIAMDDGASPVTTTLVSMFQTNRVAIRAERTITWARRRDDAVYYITSANYGGTA